MGQSILQDWVQELGLRHQGVLLGAVRGCDTAPKGDPSKHFVRMLRGMILNAHCGDPKKAQTYIDDPFGDYDWLRTRFDDFRKNLDHYPHHYVMHVIHAIEIIGYKYPDEIVGAIWLTMYFRLCRGLHVPPEGEEELDARLNADEDTFGQRKGE